jgi:hypothetical protein
MKSLTTPDFWKSYLELSPEMRQKARSTDKLWKSNPAHPFLHFKKVGKNLWSIRISGGYRALVLEKSDDYS